MDDVGDPLIALQLTTGNGNRAKTANIEEKVTLERQLVSSQECKESNFCKTRGCSFQTQDFHYQYLDRSQSIESLK